MRLILHEQVNPIDAVFREFVADDCFLPVGAVTRLEHLDDVADDARDKNLWRDGHMKGLRLDEGLVVCALQTKDLGGPKEEEGEVNRGSVHAQGAILVQVVAAKRTHSKCVIVHEQVNRRFDATGNRKLRRLLLRPTLGKGGFNDIILRDEGPRKLGRGFFEASLDGSALFGRRDDDELGYVRDA